MWDQGTTNFKENVRANKHTDIIKDLYFIMTSIGLGPNILLLEELRNQKLKSSRLRTLDDDQSSTLMKSETYFCCNAYVDRTL